MRRQMIANTWEVQYPVVHIGCQLEQAFGSESEKKVGLILDRHGTGCCLSGVTLQLKPDPVNDKTSFWTASVVFSKSR